jgi:hypothetical protein
MTSPQQLQAVRLLGIVDLNNFINVFDDESAFVTMPSLVEVSDMNSQTKEF